MYSSRENFYEQQVLSEDAIQWIFSRWYISRVIIIICWEKGKKEDTDESPESCLGHAILLSRCYFAIARLKRGNIVKPGWFLWHRKENPAWSSMKIIALSITEWEIVHLSALEIIYQRTSCIGILLKVSILQNFSYAFFYNVIATNSPNLNECIINFEFIASIMQYYIFVLHFAIAKW